MNKQSITNQTNYNQEFYKMIAGEQISKDPIVLLGTIGVGFCCYVGTKGLFVNAKTLEPYLCLILGLIIVPICCFFLPYKNYCNAYKRAMKLTNNKDFIVEVKFSFESLNMKNNLKQSMLHNYENVSSIDIKKNLIIIRLKKEKPIYINKESFIDATYEEFKEYMNKNTKVKINE